MLPWILVGVAVALAFAGWIANVRCRIREAELRTRLDSARGDLERKTRDLDFMTREKERAEREKALSDGALAAERTALEKAEFAMIGRFGTLAADALRANNASFLTLAQQELGKQQLAASTNLDSKEKAIETLLKPVGQALESLQKTTYDLEVKREGAYQAVLGAVKGVAEVSDRLGAGTRQLIDALRKPQVRGNWGQEQLERCVEFAGMVEHVSFDKEVAVRNGDTSLRPDCVVHLPNERTIVIDVKTPLEALLNATSCEDPAERAGWLVAHARSVKKHLDDLSSKAYWKQFRESPEFVVCFLPSEASFSAALEEDSDLIEYGSRVNVILATPTTLIALLKAVAYGWQQMEITRNATAIREAGEKLYDKITTAQKYFEDLGTSLKRAVAHYNNLIGCIEGRDSVFDQAREMHNLGISKREIEEVQPLLDSMPRGLKATDWRDDKMRSRLELAAEADENGE
jgi:DNA recombination protein RmuC